jgi:hypothetical protein
MILGLVLEACLLRRDDAFECGICRWRGIRLLTGSNDRDFQAVLLVVRELLR